MESNNKILSNQLVVMSRSDRDTLVDEMAQNIVAAQTKNAPCDCEAWMDVPEEERFLTRKETARLLHVCLTTLWRWNNEKRLLARKIGGRHVMYKYTDVLALLK